MNTEDVIESLAALAHEHRLAVYRLLIEQGPDGLSAGVIAERVNLIPSSLTFHIQILQRARLITQRPESRQVFYAADFGAMNALVNYLTENCCGQNARSCAPACLPATRIVKPKKPRRAA